MDHPRHPLPSCVLATLLAALALLAAPLAQASHASVLPGPVVTPDWLHAHQQSIEIVDIRDDLNSIGDPPEYRISHGHRYLIRVGGHIPHARTLNFWALRTAHNVDGRRLDYQFLDAAEFQALVRNADILSHRPIVLVPTGDTAASLQEASYLALEFEEYGVPANQLAILDGGTHAWIADGFPISTELILPETTSHWTASAPKSNLLATTRQVDSARHQGTRLLDARPLTQFIGLTRSRVLPKAGRIDGARALPPAALYRQAQDGAWHFLDAAQYRHALKALGLDTNKPTIVYCNTGQFAAGAWYILARILDEPGVREYTGSMYTWESLNKPVAGP